jgi:hypothetical protein
LKVDHKGLVQILHSFGQLEEVIKEVELQKKLEEKENKMSLQIQSSPPSQFLGERFGKAENEFLQETTKVRVERTIINFRIEQCAEPLRSEEVFGEFLI